MAGAEGLAEVNQQLTTMLRQEPNFAYRPIMTVLTPHEGLSAVLSDDQGGEYAAVEHLLNLGHRHILHFWLPPNDTIYQYRMRHAGCRQALQARGLDPEVYLHACPWDF